MRTMVSAVISIFALLCSPRSYGQQECVERIKAASVAMSQSAIGLNQEQLKALATEAFAVSISSYTDCLLWDADIHKALSPYETSTPPKVEVEALHDTMHSPAAHPDKIVFPAEFAAYAMALGMIVAHDASVRGRYFPQLPDELGSTPYRRSMLAPLLQPIYGFIKPEVFDAIRPNLGCPTSDPTCTQLLGVGLMVPVCFAVLHENAHQRLHHSGVDAHTAEQELAADASALAALRILRGILIKDQPADMAKAISWIFDTAPVLWLQAEALRLPSDSTATARLQAALNFDPALKRTLQIYITAEHHANNISTLQLHIDHPVDFYLVDGVRIRPADVPANGYLVSSHAHTVVAVGADGIGVSRSDGDVSFVFQSFASPASKQKIVQDEADGNYESLLAETSAANLSPLSDELIWYQTEALHYLDLDSLIALHTADALQADQLQQLLRWQQRREPIGSWRYVSDAVR